MKKFTILSFLITSFLCTFSQNSKLTAEELEEYKTETQQIVTYLQETLNFIGDPENTTQEKDIIFKESYAKIFLDDKVQVEDDLETKRSTYINKDVQAYLKDVDFFFEKAKFSFVIKEITPMTNEKGDMFFKVSMNRTLNAKSITSDTISDTRQRFLELNLDPYKKVLKIVSLYTTKFNEKEEQLEWWNSLSLKWRAVLAKDIFIDTIPMAEVIQVTDTAVTLLSGQVIKDDIDTYVSRIAEIIKTKKVDISGTKIIDLTPLAKLDDLEVLNCANTDVESISPIRNLNKINELRINGTQIKDISDLRYANNIRILVAFNTPINDISTLELFANLTHLSLAHTRVKDFDILSQCTNLQQLDLTGDSLNNIEFVSSLTNLTYLEIGGTQVSDLTPLQGLEQLMYVGFDDTEVTSLQPLSTLEKLSELSFNKTKISNLDVLDGLQELMKIYCDNTLVDANIASAYRTKHPATLVIYESEALLNWWNELPYYWRSLLATECGTATTPSIEDLHKIIGMKSLTIDKPFQDFLPLIRLTNLETLDLSKAKIDDLRPLAPLRQLQFLNLEGAKISDLKVLSSLVNLQELNIKNTQVKDIQPLFVLHNLRKINADGTGISRDQVVALRQKNPEVKVIYQTAALSVWWGMLPSEWRQIFKQYVTIEGNPTDENLRYISDLEEVNASSKMLTTLEPLSKLRFLKKLDIHDNRISDLSPLTDCPMLTVLVAGGNPISDLKAIATLENIEVLDIENTPVKDLSPVSKMLKIKELNIGGTSISKLNALEKHNALENLLIMNTDVKKLAPVEALPSLRYIKAFNTRIKTKDIEKLKEKRPDLNIQHY